MLATAIIIFREVLEAALIITLVLAATRGVAGRGLWVSAGVGAGAALAVVIALFADVISAAAEGVGQELLNAAVLFAAVIMLGWHNVWMRRHGAELVQEMRRWGQAVVDGERPLSVLSVVVGLAVLREGAEVVLFMHGVLATGTNGAAMLAGGVLGLAGGAALGAVLYFGLMRIPTRHVFNVSAWLLLLLAAGMASQGAAYLVQADVLPPLGQSLWDSSAVLSQRGLVGQMLHTLVGYVDRPMGIQLLFYVATLAVIGVLMWRYGAGTRRVSAAASVATAGLVALFTLSAPTPAQATHKVYSPYVEQGEWELELRGHRDFDSDDAVDGAEKMKVEVGYGVTDYWFTSIYAEIEKAPGGEREHEATAWENIFQLSEQGEYWLDWGLYAEYEYAHEDDAADKVELKVLLEKPLTRIVHTANIIFETEVGGGAEDEIEFGYAWRTKWQYRPQLEPAIELYGEFGELTDFDKSSEQVHQGGPVILGEFKLTPTSVLAYELGYLFGLTSASPNGTIKWLLEYEFRF